MNFDVASDNKKLETKQNKTEQQQNVKRNTAQHNKRQAKIITKQKTKLQHRLFFAAFSFLRFLALESQ